MPLNLLHSDTLSAWDVVGMKRDIKTFRDICSINGMTDEERFEFSEYIHDLKRSGHVGSGTGGDFTFQELSQLAREFMGTPDDDSES